MNSILPLSTPLTISGASILVASLPDIIKSKRAANRPRDRAVLEILDQALEEAGRTQPTRQHEALARESARVDRDRIRRWQALPSEKRTHFLRKRLGLRGSAL